MRLLHVGFGFRPWIVNGLILSSEAVMEGQVRQGHEVGYLFPARQLPVLRRAFLHRWERGGVQMYEWVNSSLIVGRHRGTPEPERDLDDHSGEAVFRRVLSWFTPDVVHVHDLGGLPSSVLDIARAAGLPTVMTIHDYHPLCPTVKLYDAHDQICLRREPGEMCAVCCADAPDDNSEDLARTLWYARRSLRSKIPPLDAALRRGRGLSQAGARVMDRAAGVSTAAPGPLAVARPPRAPTAAYQRRRDVNLERLNRLDAVIASSRRSAEIFHELGVTEPPVDVLPINPPHIERLRPKAEQMPGQPLRFVALGACGSTQKGAELIAAALELLDQRGLGERYRLLVYGGVAPHVQSRLSEHGSVELRGDYRVEQLDHLLDEADVGLFPSVWEEVYGFVALEFLAKGIPVIGNAVGAIPEHVRLGETGWLNRTASAAELAELMAAAIADPAGVQWMTENIVRLRGELIPPFETGLERLEAVYRRISERQ